MHLLYASAVLHLPGLSWTATAHQCKLPHPMQMALQVSGVIPEAIHAIFSHLALLKDWQCSVRVSFVEIHRVTFLTVNC